MTVSALPAPDAAADSPGAAACHHCAIATRVTRALEGQRLLIRDEENPSLDLEPADGFDNSSAPPSTTASPPAPTPGARP